ncbi:MAG: ABC transporter ATP-binding protein [Chromatiales bacterium]|nr:MAG: ABC transporter ATP-binding protein [Chromatiales bacterium]
MTRRGVDLALRAVSKRYSGGAGTGIVLDDIDLRVSAGDYVVVIGRSGSGKSTLLNLLGGLDRPSSGAVLVDERNLGAMSERELATLRRCQIGFVFQAFNLIPTLTVEENLLVPLQLNGVDRRAASARVGRVLHDAGMAGLQARFPEELSGGEQQRVAVLRAIVHEPDVVIADEPTGNLDLATARQTLELLESFAGKADRSLVMATHSQEVMGRARRVLEIRAGRLYEVDTRGQSR